MKYCIALFLLFCTSLATQGQVVTQKDSSSVSFEVFQEGEFTKHRRVEVNYKEVYLNVYERFVNGQYNPRKYIARYKTDYTTIESLEGRVSTVEVSVRSLKNLSKVMFETKHDCDDLFFEAGYYKTVKMGCCTEPSTITYYDFDKKEIIRGTNSIVTVEALNSPVRFFTSFTVTSQDSGYVGYITLAYAANDKYTFWVKATPAQSKRVDESPLVLCPIFAPEVLIKTSKPYNKDFNQEHSYEIDFLRGIETKDEVNNVSLHLVVDCGYSKVPIVVPIINGLPFGKTDRVHHFTLK